MKWARVGKSVKKREDQNSRNKIVLKPAVVAKKQLHETKHNQPHLSLKWWFNRMNAPILAEFNADSISNEIGSELNVNL